jgi:hypothetical protein
MLTFIKDAKLWIKHYTVVGRLATPQFDFYLRAISILNTGLRKSLWNIETAYHESCRLDAIPRLAFLVEVQDLLNFEADRSSFETFLSKHRFDLDGWRMPYHSHPWAWDVLRMYEAINAKLGTGESAFFHPSSCRF